MNELATTAIALAVGGVLMGVSVLASQASGRVPIPVALIFLVIGMLAGSEGIGGVAFEDYALSFRVGTVTLVLILFDGGLSAAHASIRRVIAPGVVLATVGVLATAALVALGARLMGFSWGEAFLLGAVVSPTDAAAVFAVLRGSGAAIEERVAATLELESGLNDPVAIILTIALTAAEEGRVASGAHLALVIAIELVVGCAGGLVVGFAGRWLVQRARPAASGLLPVLTIALAFVAFGATTLVHGSGFLATYLAGLILGAGELPNRTALLRVHDAVAWLGQVIMFLVLGLLSFPSRLFGVGWVGLALALVLALVARPLSAVACLLPFRFPMRESLFVGWVGLRGAVPIILAMFPVLAGAPEAHHIFNVVFFIVVLSTIIPGATVRWVARRLSTPAR